MASRRRVEAHYWRETLSLLPFVACVCRSACIGISICVEHIRATIRHERHSHAHLHTRLHINIQRGRKTFPRDPFSIPDPFLVSFLLCVIARWGTATVQNFRKEPFQSMDRINHCSPDLESSLPRELEQLSTLHVQKCKKPKTKNKFM